MSEHNDGHYSSSFYPESQLGRQSNGYPTIATPRRMPRYSRASGAPSWVSNGILSPRSYVGPPSTNGSRPLPVPSPAPSRVMSDFQPVYPPPSEIEGDPEPEAYPGPPTSEPRDDREWEPEENMTIGPSMNEDEYGFADYPVAQDEVIPENEPTVFPIAPEIQGAEPKPRNRAKNFVGGFVSGLRRLPKAVVKGHFHDRKSTRKGAPGTEFSPGQSNFLPAELEDIPGHSNYLPAYNDPGTTVSHPESVHYVQGVAMPEAQKSPTEISYAADPTRRASQQRASQQRSSRRSSSHRASSALVASSPRFINPPQSPVVVEPLPASDYAKMDSPIRYPAPDDSFSAHITRVSNFFHHLKALPWTSDRVALDYIPHHSERAHIGKAKPKGSWYSIKGHQDIDLLASGPARPAEMRLHSEDGATSASIRSASRIRPDGHTPLSYMTSPGLIPSPGASSHGQGQHMASYSYYFAPPQPLYVYQSPMTSPLSRNGTPSSSSSMSPPEAHQAVPVYMMAGPPPGLIPSPPPAIHIAQHTHSNRAASPPVSLSRAQSPSQRRNSRNSRTSGSNAH